VVGHFSTVLAISAFFVSSEKDPSAISTDFAFTVELILNDPKGNVSKVDSTLVVNQTGVKNGRVTQLIIGDPLFVVNERAIHGLAYGRGQLVQWNRNEVFWFSQFFH